MKKQSLLWKVTKDNSEPSYLFGTMHVHDSRVFQYISQLEILINTCEAFACEFNLDEVDPIQVAQQAMLPEGQTILDLLTPKQIKRISKFLEKRHLSLQHFYQQKPMTISNILTMMVFQKEMQKSLDETLFQLAKDKAKTLYGLETFQDQLQIMESITLKSQVQQLIGITRNFKKFKKTLEKLTLSYSKGDIHSLYQSSKKSLGKLRHTMLYDRNETMANRFEILTENNTLFCAIGAGHLSGKKGVLKLLKKKGYKLKPIHF